MEHTMLDICICGHGRNQHNEHKAQGFPIVCHNYGCVCTGFVLAPHICIAHKWYSQNKRCPLCAEETQQHADWLYTYNDMVRERLKGRLEQHKIDCCSSIKGCHITNDVFYGCDVFREIETAIELLPTEGVI